MDQQDEQPGISIRFSSSELDTLQRLCQEDVRSISDQIRWLIISEAQRRGIIPTVEEERARQKKNEAQRQARAEQKRIDLERRERFRKEKESSENLLAERERIRQEVLAEIEHERRTQERLEKEKRDREEHLKQEREKKERALRGMEDKQKELQASGLWPKNHPPVRDSAEDNDKQSIN